MNVHNTVEQALHVSHVSHDEDYDDEAITVTSLSIKDLTGLSDALDNIGGFDQGDESERLWDAANETVVAKVSESISNAAEFDAPDRELTAKKAYAAIGQSSADHSPTSETAVVVSAKRSSSVESQGLKELRKQVFVLSDSGKPIYARYGNEQDFATLTPMLQTLVSIMQANRNELHSITTGSCKFVFLHRRPLTVVIVSRGLESVPQLQREATCIYNKIVSLLTETQLRRIAEQLSNFDFRRLLSDVERSYETLLNMMSSSPCVMLNAFQCLPLPSGVRETINGAILSCAAKTKNLVFAILVAEDHIIMVAATKNVTINPSDLHLIMNLVAANPSFRSYAEGLWIPVCLPHFNNTGYLHAHTSYLSSSCPACLLLLNVDSNSFAEMKGLSHKIFEKLSKANVIDAISEACAKRGFTVSEVGIPELVHFLYKIRYSGQYASPEMELPHTAETEQERLSGIYLNLHHQLHVKDSLVKLLFSSGDREVILGQVTARFELYATYSPLTTKAEALVFTAKLLKWLDKQEARLFLTNPVEF